MSRATKVPVSGMNLPRSAAFGPMPQLCDTAMMKQRGGDSIFIRRVLILLGILAAVALLFSLSQLLMLMFGSVVVATVLTAVAKPIQRWLRLPRGVSLTMAILLLLGLIGGAFALFGSQAIAQAQQLGDQLPAAWDQFRGRLGQWGISLPDIRAENQAVAPGLPEIGILPDPMRQLDQDLVTRVGRWLMNVFQAIGNTLLVLVGGIYLAAEPQLYRTGLLKLIPKKERPIIDDAYQHTARALQYWLLGTAISMLAVGSLTWLGLWALGVPSALALALLAGILEFVPFIGPVASSIPAILIAFTGGLDLAIWTGLLFVGVQQIEGNVIQPIAQRYAVDLPPALLLFSIVAAGFLFGIVGVIFAAPLTVVAYVLIKRLYVREALHTQTTLPDER
jgi:predicted PurR-regulated permease PerM